MFRSFNHLYTFKFILATNNIVFCNIIYMVVKTLFTTEPVITTKQNCFMANANLTITF